MTTVILKEARSQARTPEILYVWNHCKELVKNEIQTIVRTNWRAQIWGKMGHKYWNLFNGYVCVPSIMHIINLD